MDDVSNIRIGQLPEDSPYVKPFRFYYTQGGKEKNWDLLKVHDSVAIIVFNEDQKKLVLVKQFRPAVYYGIITNELLESGKIDMVKYPPKMAITLELCAGIVDKDLPLVEIAKEEVLEECGYNVPVSRIEEIMQYRSGVGTSGSLQTLFYCTVKDSDKLAGSGGGVDDEIIEVVDVSLDEARAMVQKGTSHSSPPSFLFGILYFLTNLAPK